MPSSPAPTCPMLSSLSPAARLLVAACRAGEADLRSGQGWEEGELLALCDAVGLRRCAAARLGAFVACLLREARQATGRPCLQPLGCPCLSPSELMLAAAVAAPSAQAAAARRAIAGWWPPRRRVQGLALLFLATEDLSGWAARA